MPGLTKPVAYDTTGAPKSEIRKIVGASNTSHIQETGAEIVYSVLGVAMGRSGAGSCGDYVQKEKSAIARLGT